MNLLKQFLYYHITTDKLLFVNTFFDILNCTLLLQCLYCISLLYINLYYIKLYIILHLEYLWVNVILTGLRDS